MELRNVSTKSNNVYTKTSHSTRTSDGLLEQLTVFKVSENSNYINSLVISAAQLFSKKDSKLVG